MSVLSLTQKRRRRIPNKVKFKSVGDHDEFLRRIKKTLYYGKIPLTERFSLPVSEFAAEWYSNIKSEHSLERLCVDETADISRNACVSPCSLILALFYLERLKNCNQDYLDRVSPSELFVVSMMIASKFLHDDGEEDEVFNTEWAKSAGIQVNEINRYEKDFLNAINWEVFVKESEFWAGLSKMERTIAKREANRRGWFSYSELDVLLDMVDAWALAQTLVVVSVVCLTSYTASVLTLLGSAFISSQITSGIIPASVSLQTNVPAQTRLYLPSDNLASMNTIDCFGDNNNLNMTCLRYLSEANDHNSSTEESTRNKKNRNVSLRISDFLSLSTLWWKLTKSFDDVGNSFYSSFTKNNDPRLLMNFNETETGLVDMIRKVISATEAKKRNSYNAIGYFMKNIVDSSDVLINGNDGDTNSLNQLNYFLRILKFPS